MGNDTSVLVVEDNAAVRVALVKTIIQFGMTVHSSGDPVEALEKLAALDPDVVVLDWELGGQISGIDIADHIAKEGMNAQVIFITGNSVASLRRRTSHFNVAAYLQKPFRLKELKGAFEKI